MSLRRRLGLTVAPLVGLVLALGGGGVGLLDDLGRRAGGIIRENYVSLRLMADLAGKLDSANFLALQVVVAGADAEEGRGKFRAVLRDARDLCDRERNNLTVPGEDRASEQLTRAVDELARRGEHLFDLAPTARPGFYDLDNRAGFRAAWFDAQTATRVIRLMNEEAMYEADRAAQATARRSARVLAAATVLALLATALLGWRTGRAILRPVEDLTRSARAVGDGRFDLPVTATTRDEVGDLVAAFNRMTAQLRDLRQSQAARLLRAQQASQATLDAFPDPVLVIDPGGRVEMANPAARQALGVVPGAEPAWQPPDALREPLAAALADQRPTLSRSFDQAVVYRTGGEERTFIPQVLPVRDPHGGTLGAAVVLNDVTRFRLLDEFKTDLVATASHELKTPLAGLRLAVHLLLEEAVGPLTAKQTDLLIDARDNTERLVRIADHLLVLARLERGQERLDLRPVPAADLLRAAVERVQARLNGRRVRLVPGPPDLPPVAADPDRLGPALDNLLVNAATYTGPDGLITLSTRPASDGRVELAVADTGVGIPADYLPHVFDKFFRIPGQSQGGGTGLGLAIVREVATAHGGTVACESEPGWGTTFRLTLPAWRGEP